MINQFFDILGSIELIYNLPRSDIYAGKKYSFLSHIQATLETVSSLTWVGTVSILLHFTNELRKILKIRNVQTLHQKMHKKHSP